MSALQVSLLFDNGATVFFAIVMAFWGEFAMLCVCRASACVYASFEV